ncbi:MAG: aminopeptidase P N-terminal domain-containing protein [Dehalococcoidia bacterium]
MPSNSPLKDRRARIAHEWNLARGAAMVPSGLHVPVQGTDQYHEFHAHPEFSYLAGTQLPGAVLAFDEAAGWLLFAPEADLEDRVWVGDGVDHEELAERTGLDVRPLSELQPWLEERRAEPLAILGNHDISRVPAGYGLRNWSSLELDIDENLAERLSTQVSDARRAKDATEIALMQSAADASRAGHLYALRQTRPGLTERQLQIEVEAEFFRAGAERTAYGSIVGTGSNGAVLHFSPTERAMRDGEIVLMDAGAEFEGYASDVTRTFPVGPRFSGAQRDLYQLVLDVQQSAIAAARPGVEYRDLHLAACHQIAEGLSQLGILKGRADELVERDAHALFFPHGLGHMLGLSTHDAGGCLAGRTPSDRFGLKWLRADLPLQPGYVVTIEPGIYFIKALIDDPQRRSDFADCIDWAKVEAMRDFGGIRIEDDVLITEGGSRVLTAAIPKTIAEIESLRAEAFSS